MKLGVLKVFLKNRLDFSIEKKIILPRTLKNDFIKFTMSKKSGFRWNNRFYTNSTKNQVHEALKSPQNVGFKWSISRFTIIIIINYYFI